MKEAASLAAVDQREGAAVAADRARARICFPFTGDVIGGSHLSVLGLLSCLDERRFTPLVVTQYPDGKIARLFRDHGLPVTSPFDWPEVPVETRVGLNGARAALAKLGPMIRFLRAQKIDIVHTNDGRTHVVWALAAKIGGTKLLWHHRGDPQARGLRFAAPFLADQVLAVSQFSLPPPGVLNLRRRAKVVHSPFDTELSVDRAAARADLIAELGVSADTLLPAYFGTFIPRKRPLLFIEMIARLREIAPELRVMGLMFGAADDPGMGGAMQRRIADLDLADRIRLMGWRSPGMKWIAACDQLVIPAVGEPFGRTLVEAMLVGTPVVATRSGGNVEALRDGRLGWLVEPENPDALARAVAEAARSGAGDLVAAAHADARMRFGMDMHCRQVSDVYDALMSKP